MRIAEIEGFRIEGGDRGSLLLLHGFTGSPFEMRGLGEELATAGYSVCGPRLPGHGRPLAEEENSFHSWRSTIEASLREARALLPGRPVTLIGLSLGALLALDAARRFPDDVRAVVALSPAIDLTRPLPSVLWLVRMLSPAAARAWMIPKGVSDIQDLEARNAHPRSNPFPISAFLSFDEFRREVRRVCGTVRQPLLIIHSRKDRTCPLSGADWLSQRTSSSAVEMHVLEHSGHVLTVDNQRAEAAALILDFLNRQE